VKNMEQFAFLHGNPSPIFNLPVDFSLLGEERTKKWVRTFGQDNARFQREFASAWRKVTSAGWDLPEAQRPKQGWSGGALQSCRKMPCTATGGKFVCPVDVLSDRLRYLPKPASLRLELGNCTAAADSASTEHIPGDSAIGECELIGGFGVRGTVRCGGHKYHCCSRRACEWEEWLIRHRKADKADEPTCPFTKEEKQSEIDKTKAAWSAAAEHLPPHTLPRPKDLGYDYYAAQNASFVSLLEKEKQAKKWYFARFVNKTLPKELDDIKNANGQTVLTAMGAPKDTLAAVVPPTAGVWMGKAPGRLTNAYLQDSEPNSFAMYKPM